MEDDPFSCPRPCVQKWRMTPFLGLQKWRMSPLLARGGDGGGMVRSFGRRPGDGHVSNDKKGNDKKGDDRKGSSSFFRPYVCGRLRTCHASPESLAAGSPTT